MPNSQSRAVLMLISVILAALCTGCPDNSSRRGGSSGSGSFTKPPPPPPGTFSATRTRYSLNNQCWAMKANGNGNYIVRNNDGSYSASSAEISSSAPLNFKPAALGSYLIYNALEQLMAASGSAVTSAARSSVSENDLWTVLGITAQDSIDDTPYPVTPVFDQEPTTNGAADTWDVVYYREFIDPGLKFSEFTLRNADTGENLAIDANGSVITVAAGSDLVNESFSFEPRSGCATFPEAQSNVVGEGLVEPPASYATAPGQPVTGLADVHVHYSSSTFLGNAQYGANYHRFGVEHALGNCSGNHGLLGLRDGVGAAFSGDIDGHQTQGYPAFPDWPQRDALTHEAIYWKWMERAWQAGLRIAVNDLVDNESLCELTRNINDTPFVNCNSMINARDQVGTMYGLQDYIDAQYGGRGHGWFRIVTSPEQARSVVEQGKLAVILGIEISNLVNCKINYNPLRQEQPFEEEDRGDGTTNSYGCLMTETGNPDLADQEILPQLQKLWDLGVRQIISIHEFDNAFGGNGIFDGEILNLGNRENSGGIPSGFLASPFEADLETPTGEFWTTYTCPVENETPGFTGYLFEDAGGTSLTNLGLPPPGCLFLGQGDGTSGSNRPGGTTACYPAENQCNARWMTPMGLYFYSKLMEMGFIFDWDHMEFAMKTQALELAEAQAVPYPFVSTHGMFGGTSIDQARRLLKNGGFIYPSNNGDVLNTIRKMSELKIVYDELAASLGPEDDPLPSFAMGFGTDTNGLSAQSAPRKSSDIGPGEAVTYPFTLFDGEGFEDIPAFNTISGKMFNQPDVRDPAGRGRSWHEDLDGNAHYGMLADWLESYRREAPEQLEFLFNSAELYLQTWSRTLQASSEINENGGVTVPTGILREAPVAGNQPDESHNIR